MEYICSLGASQLSAAKASSSSGALLDTYLQSQLGLPAEWLQAPRRRQSCGSLTHIFTHIRQTLHVEWLQLDRSASDLGPVPAGGPPLRWVTLAELESAAVITGVRKCFDLVRKTIAAPKPQRSIGSFFQAAKKTAS
jgi:adenine-specific DNA glycosylase